jgi:acetylornithine deacetylase/succinyl-diaminopimelate desuccinylase-like protein
MRERTRPHRVGAGPGAVTAPFHHRGATALLLAGLLSIAGLLAACAATPLQTSGGSGIATPPSTTAPSDATVPSRAITEAGLQARMDALADVSMGTGFRAVGAPGFDAAADLVAADLRAAGWTVTEDRFTTASFADPGGSRLTVDGQSFGADDIRPLIFAPAGEVSGPVVAIDWDPKALEPTGLGCTPADYGTLPKGAIVLVRTAACLDREQVIAAQEAGAGAFVLGNPSAGSGDVLRSTLIFPDGLEIPAVAASRPVGEALAAVAAEGRTARLVTHAVTKPAATRSVIGELRGSQPDKVIMLGAHLDSVIDGPGVNDNGSGVAALLEIARALSGRHPRATVRLAFWSGEELGLHGSFRYVNGLSKQDRQAIVAYLNADMVASPNGFAGIYDESGAPAGSSSIRDLLTAAVTGTGATPVPVDVGGGSDHYAFGQAGIPTGGVFSGASEPVSATEAAASNATAGQPADPCYHRPCDDGSKVDLGLARSLVAALLAVTVQLSDDPTLLSG